MLRGWRRTGEAIHQCGEVTYWILVAPFKGQMPRFAATSDQVNRFGTSAIPIVALISLLIGLIMAMQSAHQLRQFGAVIFVADLVGISTCRELGPFVTAIVVAGRSGSAVAAELGTVGLIPFLYLIYCGFSASRSARKTVTGSPHGPPRAGPARRPAPAGGRSWRSRTTGTRPS